MMFPFKKEEALKKVIDIKCYKQKAALAQGMKFLNDQTLQFTWLSSNKQVNLCQKVPTSVYFAPIQLVNIDYKPAYNLHNCYI